MKKILISMMCILISSIVFAGSVFASHRHTKKEETEKQPPYIEAGVWDADFERTNPNLNGLLWECKDKAFTKLKTKEATNKGTVVPVTYDTYYYAYDAQNGDVNSHATPVTKTCYVYLPAGYDESRQYNILYLYHGGGDDEKAWFMNIDRTSGDRLPEVGHGYAVNVIDHAIEDGICEPLIIVTPTFYCYEMDEKLGLTGENHINTDLVDYAAYELRNDIIPVIEATYSTYAADTTPEGLAASRDHRAMAGLSMGSMTTWRSGIIQCLDLFSWFGNMSAATAAEPEIAVADTNEKIIPAIEAAHEQGYDINMMISFNGTEDIALSSHVLMHHEFLKWMENSDLLRVGENYDFLVSDGAHMFNSWNMYLYDCLKVFFK